jgi:hypothetical protein
MKESFKSHPVLSQIIDDPRSLDRRLLLDKMMYVPDANDHILDFHRHNNDSE